MIISFAHKLIFFHISKTGGTSVRVLLSRLCSDKHLSYKKLCVENINHPNVQHLCDKWEEHYKGQDIPYFPTMHIHQTDFKPFLKINNIDISNFNEFIVVRNPYRRGVSQLAYENKNNDINVNEILDCYERNIDKKNNYYYNSQLSYVNDPITKNLLIFKFEELYKIWEKFLEIFNNKNIPIPHFNFNKNNKNINLNLSQKQSIYNFFKDEFEYFGYSKNF